MTGVQTCALPIFRRFDDVVEYHVPTPAQAFELIRSRLGSFAPKPFKKDGLPEQAAGLSCAEICRAVDESIKGAIMIDQPKVQRTLLGSALDERRLISTKVSTRK